MARMLFEGGVHRTFQPRLVDPSSKIVQVSPRATYENGQDFANTLNRPHPVAQGELNAPRFGEHSEKVVSSWTCKPNSVREIAFAGRSFLWAAHYCEAQATYPEVVTRRAGTSAGEPARPSLFGLAPCGVCHACRITAAAVRSYRTFSPLPRPCGRGGIFSVALAVEWTSVPPSQNRA